MPDTSAVIDLRKYVPGLPTTLTRESLDKLSPEQQAALLQSFETGLTNIRIEQARAETTIAQRSAEVERIQAEVQQEFGVSTLEDLERLRDEAAESVVACWAEVESLLNAQAT